MANLHSYPSSSSLNRWLSRLLAVMLLVASFGLAAGCSPEQGGTPETVEQSAETQSAVDAEEAHSIQVFVAVSSGENTPAIDVQKEVSLEENANAYDALLATDLQIDAQESSYGIYVTAIEGLAAEGSSGWTYTVNGETPSVGADSYSLKDGDNVLWSYTTYEG